MPCDMSLVVLVTCHLMSCDMSLETPETDEVDAGGGPVVGDTRCGGVTPPGVMMLILVAYPYAKPGPLWVGRKGRLVVLVDSH